MNEILITVGIADRHYKLTINREEEEIFRNATKLLSDKLMEYAQNYAYKDKQDLLAMVALQYTTSTLKLEKEASFRDKELEIKLKEIDKVLSDNIS